MTQEKRDFVYECFVNCFLFMEARDIESLFTSMEDDICQDIEETADEDFTNGDVCIAIRRVLFKRLKLDEYTDLDEDNDRFIQLVRLHEGDDEFDDPADEEMYGEDENREYLIQIYNAFRQLCKERGKKWASTHSWECDADADNEYNLTIIELE